jgi:hypothetical protein
MEQGTVIFLAVLVIAIAIPIIISNIKRKQTEKILRHRMDEFAQKNQSSVTTYERWKDLQLGLDKQNGKLFFIRNTPEHEISTEIDLSQVQNVKVFKGERIITTGGEKYTAVDKINLSFTLRNNGSDIVLNFYNSGFDTPMTQGELQLAEKWQEIASAWISANRKTS